MSSPDFTVTGQSVLITGGRGGIGSAIASAFVFAGARVIAVDVSPVPDVPREGIDDVVADVRDPSSIFEAASKFGSLDTIVQCAGRAAPGEEFDPAVFREIVDIHLVGSFNVAVTLKPLMAESGGSIINVGSMYSYFGSPLVPGYGAAKAGIVQLTKTLALEWASDGVRVNAVAPGWIRTEMTRLVEEDPTLNAAITSRLPSGSFSEPEDIAGTVLYLASAASRLVTGVTIPIDGGYSAS
ncbi:SDR family NAD(P)-dependent oxidoreductase [Rhodococcus sp. H36-A4]|uniref:SDR family NAD(P)-dependent oxidoreductase n=1 Tax=Rhodococcus sp. H36-A4 TaxID=3004353 RepID=UPI0022AF11D3|nr:SDR family NAD(P)-dependent oxidoreductase [Rhodococcus sp. H36-A4]MCZ4079970.1 SDR family NAD(P)-dependent oxidoreductase [Rhodococcus sp. H36-A4]